MTSYPSPCADPREPFHTRDALENKNAWLVAAASWRVLHYVPGESFDTWATWWDEGPWPKERSAACGRTLRVDLPGMFTRMGAPRCKQCCAAVGITRGNGAPLNDATAEALDA